MSYKETIHEPFQDIHFFNRDISWLFFNERVLMEAEKETIPLLERFTFLSIFSSNLDEFFRVRMPALAALHKLHKKEKINTEEAKRNPDVAERAREIILTQQQKFGEILRSLLPLLEQNGITLYYGSQPPAEVWAAAKHYFFSEVSAFLQPYYLSDEKIDFFPENNHLYLAAIGTTAQAEDDVVVVNIPTENISRFYSVTINNRTHIVLLDDIIKAYLPELMKIEIRESYSFKVTRDAELNLTDVYNEDLADLIEKQIAKRDFGLATRFLYEPNLPAPALQLLLSKLGLKESVAIEGGRYHNLKDLSSLPVSLPRLKYDKWPAIAFPLLATQSLLEKIATEDILLHTPYHSYDSVLRFFNEAAFHPDVEEIFLTMYRVASDSRIANSLLCAAHNGKKVTVIIELKARFDEANNIKWAKKLKKAGVRILYTPNNLKVHAKIALVKTKEFAPLKSVGLLATGNLNEGTARFYTDHILLTSHKEMLEEIELLFHSFDQKQKGDETIPFKHLLVAQHNLHRSFMDLIDQEILHARRGETARITIKLNNLEEETLIRKLYAASNAGVEINLIVRGICCLVPGVKELSENIKVRRIVDRFLEHGRIYVFHNSNNKDIYLGSADWMNRNIYSRIEVCFPVYNEAHKQELLHLLDLQLMDNSQAVAIDENLQNVVLEVTEPAVRSQYKIYQQLRNKGDKEAMDKQAPSSAAMPE